MTVLALWDPGLVRIAVFLVPGCPVGRVKRWVASLKPGTRILFPSLMPHVPPTAEELRVKALAEARGLVVEFLPLVAGKVRDSSPLLKEAEAVVSFRDWRSPPALGERSALSKGMPVLLVPCRIWSA